MSDLRSRLVRCFSAVFPALSEAEVAHASNTSVGEWDSLATITLVSLIEEEFSLSIPPESLELFTSFELILDYLERTRP